MWSIYKFEDGPQMLVFDNGEVYRAYWLINNDQHNTGPQVVEAARIWVDTTHFKTWLRNRLHKMGGVQVS